MTSMVASRFVVLYISFLTNCEAIELAVMRQRWRVCLVLPVMLLIILYFKPFDSLKPAIFSFFIKMGNKIEAAELLNSSSPSRGVRTLHSNMVYGCICDRVQLTILLLQICYYRIYASSIKICLINKDKVRKWKFLR